MQHANNDDPSKDDRKNDDPGRNQPDTPVDRRSFLQTAGMVAGSVMASSAFSYSRILGANDRIALGHIGIGNRGSQLQMMAARLKGQYNVETVAVCDLWKNNRERAASAAGRDYGHAPHAVTHPEEMLALKDVEAVLIAVFKVSGDRRHGRSGAVLSPAVPVRRDSGAFDDRRE